MILCVNDFRVNNERRIFYVINFGAKMILCVNDFGIKNKENYFVFVNIIFVSKIVYV